MNETAATTQHSSALRRENSGGARKVKKCYADAKGPFIHRMGRHECDPRRPVFSGGIAARTRVDGLHGLAASFSTGGCGAANVIDR